MKNTQDFQDLTDPRMNEAAWRALDLMRAYAARDRVAIVEHLAHLEADQLEFTAGVLRNTYNDTLQVLGETGRPHNPATVVRQAVRTVSVLSAGTAGRCPPFLSLASAARSPS
ncbi:hypothetical protein [Streptomyces sp. NBC_01766]|uniref:hypothetical protein n=1 Tax=Streptomyces sp. NBC_01766 TaxID=2975936 RepID=UPI002DDB8B61|nr:hypothetical protein [Streptomyces sp. NBC_01766]